MEDKVLIEDVHVSTAAHIYVFHIVTVPLEPTIDLLLTYQGFIAQLVEQRTGIAKVMGSNLVAALKFFSG